jgi:hypothetical protein
VEFTPPRVYAADEKPSRAQRRKERGGMWSTHHLVVYAAEVSPHGIKKEMKKRNEAACGIHAASLSTPWIRALPGNEGEVGRRGRVCAIPPNCRHQERRGITTGYVVIPRPSYSLVVNENSGKRRRRRSHRHRLPAPLPPPLASPPIPPSLLLSSPPACTVGSDVAPAFVIMWVGGGRR